MNKSKMIIPIIDDYFLEAVDIAFNDAVKYEQKQEEITKERCKVFLSESCLTCKSLLIIDLMGVACKLAPNGDGRKGKRLPISCYPDCNKRADGCPLEELVDENE